jgi:hypothetical protein
MANPQFENLVHSYEKEIEKETAKYKVLRDLEFPIQKLAKM